MTADKPSTCCGRAGEECKCAKEATCSCGAKPALACSCDKAASENSIGGSTCSCGKRPAKACTCSRAEAENAGGSGLREGEIDFTTK